MPTLRFSRAGAVETEVPLGAADLRVGRSADNDVILKDPEKTLSRHHAEIRRDGDAWVYLDLNSANGSWVGDRAVTREVLQPGLSIGLGDYQLTLVGAAVAGADDANLDATRVMRNLDDTLRPGAVAAPAPGRRSAAGVVGGAVPMGAPPPPPQPASSLVFRRIIIYGSIVVFGAFGVMLALILRPDPDAAVEEPAAVAAAESPAPPVSPEVPPPAAPEPAPPAAAAGQAAPSPAPVAPPAPAATPTPPPTPAARPAPRQAAAPRPARDTDPDARTIPARDGETPYALRQRRDDIRRRYQLGLQHLTARRFVEAREALAGVFADAPRFRDVSARLAEATAGIRQMAADGYREAARHEAAEEWTEAVRGYESLRPYASSLPALAEATERARRRMHEAGVNALTRARQYDTQGRLPEAAAWYKRAVEWLPPDHAGLPEARARLAQLGNRP